MSMNERVTGLAVLLVLMLARTDASCSGVFGYTRQNGQLMGALAITPPATYTLGQDFKITLKLIIGASIPQGTPMGVDLAVSASSGADKVRTRQAVPYLVRFPVQSPRPLVKSVQVNGQTVCQENPDLSSLASRTMVTLRHTLLLSGQQNIRQLDDSAPAPVRNTIAPLRQRVSSLQNCNGMYSVGERRGETGVVIRSPPPVDRNPSDSVTTKVTFMVTVRSSQGSTGGMSLYESLVTVVERLRDGRSDAIKYWLPMPIQPRPQLISIEVNGRAVCHNNLDLNQGYGQFSQSHTVFPVAR